MLKFEGIAVGTKIKAYDFEPCPGRTDRYVVGKIVDTTVRDGAKFYVIECDNDGGVSNETLSSRVGHTVYVPMEMTGDFDDRITPLDGPCADAEWIATQNMVDR